jgi:hypothetical protein
MRPPYKRRCIQAGSNKHTHSWASLAREGESDGVHPSATRCPELTELSSADEVAEVLQLAACGSPDDGERHRGPQFVQRFLESASVLARNDFPYHCGGDPPLIEREYWLRVPRWALQNANLASLDGLVILHVRYAGVWDLGDDQTAFDKKRSIITQINARYTGGIWTEAQVVLVLGSPEAPSEWSWRDPAQRRLTEYTPALQDLLQKGERCSKVVLKRFVDWVAAHSQAKAAQAHKAAAAWTTPDWSGLALAAPAPAPRPFTILFVGVNSNEKPDLNLKEEHNKVQTALDAAYGRASAHKPVVLKHVAYSTWDEVLSEIRREHPTVLHLGCHSDRHAGILLFRGTVRPKTMLPAIKAWNEHAGRKGFAQLRVIVVNACGSDGHAQELAECVDFAIGHAAPVKDKDALVFSGTLYECVCQGMSLAGSFDTARSAASPGYRIYANVDPRAFCPGGAGDTTRARGNDGSEGPSGKRARTSGVTVERATERDHIVEGVLHAVAELGTEDLGNLLNAAATELRNRQNVADKCQVCGHKNATMNCKDCEKRRCGECDEIFHRVGKFNAHRRVALLGPQSIDRTWDSATVNITYESPSCPLGPACPLGMHISAEVPACGQQRPAFILRSIGSVDEKYCRNPLQSAAIAKLYSAKTTCPQELQQIEQSKILRNEEKVESKVSLRFQKMDRDWYSVDGDWRAFVTLRSVAAGERKFLGGKTVYSEELFQQYSTWLIRRVNNLWNHCLLGVCDGRPVGWLALGGYSPHVIKFKDKTGTFVDASQDERYQAVFGGSRHRKELAGWLKPDHKGKGLGMRALQALIYEILPKLDPPPSWETEFILTIPSESTSGISKLETLGFEEVQPPSDGDASNRCFYRKTGDSSDEYSRRRVYVFRAHQVLAENNSPPLGATASAGMGDDNDDYAEISSKV